VLSGFLALFGHGGIKAALSSPTILNNFIHANIQLYPPLLLLLEMPAFHYDPFYDVERFIKDMFDRFTTHGHSSTLERQNGNDVQRSIRPR
jgi:hypothetical protein